MSDFGISDTGFKRKRLDQLLSELNAAVQSVFGENFNVSPESPDGQINGVVSESNANLWEIAEESYNAFNPSSAVGVTLSNLVQLNGLLRKEATFSRATVDITGTGLTLIPAGSTVSTSDTSSTFTTVEDLTLSAGGVGSVFVDSTVTGPIIAIAGTITTIDTPVTGWDTVTNPLDATLGSNEETDVELRARRESSVARDAQAIIDAIFAAISAVPDVTQVVVLENDTNVVDGNGQAPHSTHAIVVGGDDTEIAEAYFLKRTPGITTIGSTTIPVLDNQGIPHDTSFSRPTLVPIYVIVNLTTFSDYPVDGDEEIKQAIVDYANGDLILGRGFSLTEEVIYSELFTPINTVQGHSVDSLFIGIAPAPVGTANIPIAFDETSSFVIANITVNS